MAKIDVNKCKECSSFTFFDKTRYLVLVLSIAASSLAMSNSLALNFTVICMSKKPAIPTIEPALINGSCTDMFSTAEQSVLFSAVSLGYLVGTIFVTHLTAIFGFRKVFVVYGFLSTFATLFTPLASFAGVGFVFFMRILQGLALSTSYVAVGAISSAWSPLSNSGMFISWISCNIQLGPMITMPLAGAMCATWGWEWLYYIQGSVSMVIFVLFFLFYRDSPRFQRFISEKELQIIEEGKLKVKRSKTEIEIIPYHAIVKDLVVWGILCTMVAGIISIFFIAQFGPIYLNKALKMEVQKTGLMAAQPFLLSLFIKTLAGPLSDRLTFIGERTKVVIFASMSQFLMAFCYLAMALLSSDYTMVIEILYTAIVVLSGFNTVGVIKGTYLATQHYSHVLLAWGSIASSIFTLIMPVFVRLVVPNNTASQWGRVFILLAVLVSVANFFFVITIKVKPRPWTKNDIFEHNSNTNISVITAQH